MDENPSVAPLMGHVRHDLHCHTVYSIEANSSNMSETHSVSRSVKSETVWQRRHRLRGQTPISRGSPHVSAHSLLPLDSRDDDLKPDERRIEGYRTSQGGAHVVSRLPRPKSREEWREMSGAAVVSNYNDTISRSNVTRMPPRKTPTASSRSSSFNKLPSVSDTVEENEDGLFKESTTRLNIIQPLHRGKKNPTKPKNTVEDERSVRTSISSNRSIASAGAFAKRTYSDDHSDSENNTAKSNRSKIKMSSSSAASSVKTSTTIQSMTPFVIVKSKTKTPNLPHIVTTNTKREKPPTPTYSPSSSQLIPLHSKSDCNSSRKTGIASVETPRCSNVNIGAKYNAIANTHPNGTNTRSRSKEGTDKYQSFDEDCDTITSSNASSLQKALMKSKSTSKDTLDDNDNSNNKSQKDMISMQRQSSRVTSVSSHSIISKPNESNNMNKNNNCSKYTLSIEEQARQIVASSNNANISNDWLSSEAVAANSSSSASFSEASLHSKEGSTMKKTSSASISSSNGIRKFLRLRQSNTTVSSVTGITVATGFHISGEKSKEYESRESTTGPPRDVEFVPKKKQRGGKSRGLKYLGDCNSGDKTGIRNKKESFGRVDNYDDDVDCNPKSKDASSTMPQPLPPYQSSENYSLEYWSGLSVRAAMAVMQAKGSEMVAQKAANAVLEGAKMKRSDGKKSSKQVVLRELATKASVAVLEAGGDHRVAAAAAVAIMNDGEDSVICNTSQVERSFRKKKESGSESQREKMKTGNLKEKRYDEEIKQSQSGLSMDKYSVNTEADDDDVDDPLRSVGNVGQVHGSFVVKEQDRRIPETLPCSSNFTRNDLTKEERRKQAIEEESIAVADHQKLSTDQGKSRKDDKPAPQEPLMTRSRSSHSTRSSTKRRDIALKESPVPQPSFPDHSSVALSVHSSTPSMKAKKQILKQKEEILEEAERMNMQRQQELDARMAALDAATAALLERANNVQQEIDRQIASKQTAERITFFANQEVQDFEKVPDDCNMASFDESYVKYRDKYEDEMKFAQHEGMKFLQQPAMKEESTKTPADETKSKPPAYESLSDRIFRMLDFACVASNGSTENSFSTAIKKDQERKLNAQNKMEGVVEESNESNEIDRNDDDDYDDDSPPETNDIFPSVRDDNDEFHPGPTSPRLMAPTLSGLTEDNHTSPWSLLHDQKPENEVDAVAPSDRNKNTNPGNTVSVELTRDQNQKLLCEAMNQILNPENFVPKPQTLIVSGKKKISTFGKFKVRFKSISKRKTEEKNRETINMRKQPQPRGGQKQEVKSKPNKVQISQSKLNIVMPDSNRRISKARTSKSTLRNDKTPQTKNDQSVGGIKSFFQRKRSHSNKSMEKNLNDSLTDLGGVYTISRRPMQPAADEKTKKRPIEENDSLVEC
mmetsp:Transcript_9534/g.19792  ORF Transcript_9534/g.19792 Transcript_9534/m.19792 type:complete len:1395 (-) Transcript_9534:6-4190(-)